MKTTYNEREMQQFIFGKLKEYSTFSSLSGFEGEFLAHLRTDFKCMDGQDFREFFVNGTHMYSLLVDSAESSSVLFSVHADRVPDYRTGKAHVNTIVSGEDVLKGQLDDIIGIAILRYLHHLRVPMNIIFTTWEEHAQSWPQLLEVCQLYQNTRKNRFRLVSVDIDVFRDVKEFAGGPITLRSCDRNAKMDPILVSLMRQIADREEIPYLKDSGGFAIVEPGFLSDATHGEWTGAHVGIPLINYHTKNETTFWSCIYNTVKFLYTFMEVAQAGGTVRVRKSM